MAGTKKVGIAGRFGARYGAKTRNTWRDIMVAQKGVQKCPRCHTKIKNMRQSIGVWHCPRCGATFTGGAWAPATSRGKESHRIAVRIARETKELESTKK